MYFLRISGIIEEKRRFMEQEAQKTKKKKKSKTDWLGSIGLTLILTAVALLIWFFLNGQTTVTGEQTGVTQTSSLTCKIENAQYPIFTVDEATKKETEVKVLFDGDRMNSVSLTQTMYYDSPENAKMSRNHNHAAMNTSFGNAGLAADAFNANYTATDDRMIMTLYAAESEYNEVTAKYFLANGTSKRSSIDEFTKVLNTQGLSCYIVK